MSLLPAEVIKKKRNGLPLSEAEIQDFIQGYTNSTVPDYQMSALLMAIFFSGMNEKETLALTKSMLFSGEIVDLKDVPGFKVDKHSTGGVGDKTSLILGPIVAACGVRVPMISGRGLGHTGGTLDKLESIPGFDTQLDIQTFKTILKRISVCFIGQTKEICPADKKIYALRDVTATIESLPLICASIMSKKLAEGIDGLVLDVKFGNGAFMKTEGAATQLASALMAIARGYGKKSSALITDMNQPLGRFAGNALEVKECVEIMQGKSRIENGNDFYADTKDLSVELSAEMLFLAGYRKNIEECRAEALRVLKSGAALAKFEELCEAHGGNLNKLPMPRQSFSVCSEHEGYLDSFNTESIGVSGILLGAGRAKTTDAIEPTCGFEFHKKIGDRVDRGDPIFTLHGPDSEKLKTVAAQLKTSFSIASKAPHPPKLILKKL